MKSNECNGGNQPAGWQSQDGRIWFPTTHGVSVIDPDNLMVNTLPPPVQRLRRLLSMVNIMLPVKESMCRRERVM